MALFSELLIEQGASFSTTVNVKDAAKAQEKSGKYWSNSQTGKAFLDDIDNNLIYLHGGIGLSV